MGGFDPDAYEVKQVFFESKDGTKVPMFICHKKGLKYDGTAPVYQYGYGGFNISITPRFSVQNVVWMEMGGVYAQVTLRGGGEYGEEWHQAGMKGKKQNVFDDFIGASEWRVREVATGNDLDDHVQWVKFSRAAWAPDGSGFLYSRYDAPKEGE